MTDPDRQDEDTPSTFVPDDERTEQPAVSTVNEGEAVEDHNSKERDPAIEKPEDLEDISGSAGKDLKLLEVGEKEPTKYDYDSEGAQSFDWWERRDWQSKNHSQRHDQDSVDVHSNWQTNEHWQSNAWYADDGNDHWQGNDREGDAWQGKEWWEKSWKDNDWLHDSWHGHERQANTWQENRDTRSVDEPGSVTPLPLSRPAPSTPESVWRWSARDEGKVPTPQMCSLDEVIRGKLLNEEVCIRVNYVPLKVDEPRNSTFRRANVQVSDAATHAHIVGTFENAGTLLETFRGHEGKYVRVCVSASTQSSELRLAAGATVQPLKSGTAGFKALPLKVSPLMEILQFAPWTRCNLRFVVHSMESMGKSGNRLVLVEKESVTSKQSRGKCVRAACFDDVLPTQGVKRGSEVMIVNAAVEPGREQITMNGCSRISLGEEFPVGSLPSELEDVTWAKFPPSKKRREA